MKNNILVILFILAFVFAGCDKEKELKKEEKHSVTLKTLMDPEVVIKKR